MYVYRDNDNVVWLRGGSTLDLETGATVYLDETATVQFRVQTAEHVDVAGETWPVTMQYVPESQGDFLGVLRKAVVLEEDQQYWLIATVDAGADQYGQWEIPLHVLPRT